MSNKEILEHVRHFWEQIWAVFSRGFELLWRVSYIIGRWLVDFVFELGSNIVDHFSEIVDEIDDTYVALRFSPSDPGDITISEDLIIAIRKACDISSRSLRESQGL